MPSLTTARTLLLGLALLVFGACSSEGPTGPQGPAGPTGPAGPAGPGSDPSISSVSPLTVFLDRTSPFLIGGSATTWASPTVDFGGGITTSDVAAASPSAITGMMAVDSSAALGRRDVSVSEGGSTLVLTDGLLVEAPLVIDSILGTVAAGSRITAFTRLADVSRPFESDDLRLIFPGVSREIPVFSSSDFTAISTFLIDVDAPAGPAAFVAESGGSSGVVSRSAPVDLQARSPSDVAPGAMVSGTISEPWSSDLYSTSAPAGSLIRATVDAAGSDVQLALLGPAGRWSEARLEGDFMIWFAPDGLTWPLLLLGTETANVDYTLSVAASGAVPTAYVAPVGGDISVADEADVYSFSANAGETITATISDGAVNTCSGEIDAAIDIVGGGAFAPDEGPIFCPSTTMQAPVTGTYYVTVRAYWDCVACTFDYTLTITVE